MRAAERKRQEKKAVAALRAQLLALGIDDFDPAATSTELARLLNSALQHGEEAVADDQGSEHRTDHSDESAACPISTLPTDCWGVIFDFMTPSAVVTTLTVSSWLSFVGDESGAWDRLMTQSSPKITCEMRNDETKKSRAPVIVRRIVGGERLPSRPSSWAYPWSAAATFQHECLCRTVEAWAALRNSCWESSLAARSMCILNGRNATGRSKTMELLEHHLRKAERRVREFAAEKWLELFAESESDVIRAYARMKVNLLLRNYNTALEAGREFSLERLGADAVAQLRVAEDIRRMGEDLDEIVRQEQAEAEALLRDSGRGAAERPPATNVGQHGGWGVVIELLEKRAPTSDPLSEKDPTKDIKVVSGDGISAKTRQAIHIKKCDFKVQAAVVKERDPSATGETGEEHSPVIVHKIVRKRVPLGRSTRGAIAARIGHVISTEERGLAPKLTKVIVEKPIR